VPGQHQQPAASVSAHNVGPVNSTLATLAEQQLGGVGATIPGVAAPVDCCAEFQSVNELLNQGSAFEDTRLIDVIRPAQTRLFKNTQITDFLP
jgi:hypothetical protein